MNNNSSLVHNIILVEDDEATCQRFNRAINIHACLNVIEICSTVAEGKKALALHRPDVVLIDLGLPDGSGVELIRATRQLDEKIAIMVISVFSDERNTVAAIRAGASGYLLKDEDTSRIGEAIIHLIAGESPISAAIARHLLKPWHSGVGNFPLRNQDRNGPVPKLTQRETEVLSLISKGYTYCEVAEILGMSHHTINSHIKQIYRKLEVHSRGEAVFEAMQFGILNAVQK